MCSRTALLSACRAAILSPESLLAGLELTSTLPPPPAVLRLFLLGSLLLLAAHFHRRPEFHPTHLLSLASPRIPRRLDCSRHRSFSSRHCGRFSVSISAPMTATLLLKAPVCTPVALISFRPPVPAPAGAVFLPRAPIFAPAIAIPFHPPASGLCFTCDGGPRAPSLARGRRYCLCGDRAVLPSGHALRPASRSCSRGGVAPPVVLGPQS